MKSPLPIVAALLLVPLYATATIAQRQNPLTGEWRGYWAKTGDTMPVTMHVRQDAATKQYSATFDADRLRVSGIPFNEVQVTGCCDLKMTLRGDRTTMILNGAVRRDSLSGAFREGEDEGRFSFTRGKAARPAFEEREVTFANGSVTLAGTLIMPFMGNALPAVVFLHGSGAEGRWASRFLATQLASKGIAALIFDKRGVGKSSGDWRQATLDDLASDDAAAVDFLLQQPRIDRTRIGIHGHSQGGTLAPLVAAHSDHVAFIVGSAAAGVPTDSAEIYSVLNSVYPRALTADDSAAARTYVGELISVAYHGRPRARLDSLVATLRERPWFFAPPSADNSYWSFSRSFARYDPIRWWSQVHVPVLLLYGAEDQRVPAGESASRIAGALLRTNANADVTVRILPGADHTFRLKPGPSGWPRTARDYMPTLLDWLASHR